MMPETTTLSPEQSRDEPDFYHRAAGIFGEALY